MDQYIQKEQTTSPNSNRRQSNVLSPSDEEKLKVKKKAIKSLKEPADQDQNLMFEEEKREKSRGKKSGKLTEEQVECDAFELPQLSSIEDEKENPQRKKENAQTEMSEHESKNLCKNSNEELKGIIGSLVEEMKCL